MQAYLSIKSMIFLYWFVIYASSFTLYMLVLILIIMLAKIDNKSDNQT